MHERGNGKLKLRKGLSFVPGHTVSSAGPVIRTQVRGSLCSYLSHPDPCWGTPVLSPGHMYLDISAWKSNRHLANSYVELWFSSYQIVYFKKYFKILFIFGCAGSSLPYEGVSQGTVSGGYSLASVLGLLRALASPLVENQLLGTQTSVAAVPGL